VVKEQNKKQKPFLYDITPWNHNQVSMNKYMQLEHPNTKKENKNIMCQGWNIPSTKAKRQAFSNKG